MFRRIYHYSRLGTLLGIGNALVSILWIAIAYDNAWHEGPLMILDFPASYIVLGLDYVMLHLFSEHYTLLNISSDAFFVVVGAIWFFTIGVVVQKTSMALWNATVGRKSDQKKGPNNRRPRTPRFRCVCTSRQWRGAAAAER